MAHGRNEATGHQPDPNYAGSLLRRSSPIIGGLASGSNKPGGNVLLLNDRVLRTGGVGLSLSGKIRVDSLVSQGCRPIGPTLLVTGCKGQMITHLGGRPALEALEEILDSLGPAMRERLRRGLFIGRAINEYKDRFGRDDFLIRHVIGVDKEHKFIAVADLLRIGQTIQFHVRDAATASEDLALLLDMQKLYEPPAGVLLFTCNGRGTRLFERPHHDAAAFARAFAPPMTGEQQAKGGTAMSAPSGGVPLAGFFCAGEIGPVGDQVFVHGQTTCAALFRPMN
jgi:small ligand-binding sensory domain FIST